MKEWFRVFDDSLWLKPDEVGREEAAFIRRVLRLRKGKKVLDAPCGAGRISIHLARAGCVITGVDLRHKFIRRARARFKKEGLEGTFKVMDIRKLDFNSEFDGILNWFGSFGYFSEEENLELLRRYARALRPGGRLIIDQLNREFVLRHFYSRRTVDGVTMYNRWDPKMERINSTWVIQDGQRKKNPLSLRLYTPGQMKTLWNRAGLIVEDVYGNFSGDRYRRSHRRMIALGIKKR
jgi:SAM-dependent methyltransferase